MSLRAYVPPLLAERLACAGEAAPPWRERVPGALLLSDIAGFTALTTDLARHGRQGAEQVAGIVNGVFGPCIGAVEARGGQVLGFGGDALLSRFADVAAAAAAATDIAGIAAACVAAPVRVTQALSGGPLLASHVGTPGARHLVLHGRALRRLAALLQSTASGTIASPPPSRERLSPPPAAGTLAAVPDESLAAYVPPALRPVLGTTSGDFRHVALLFLETCGDRLEPLDELHRRLAEVLESHGGVLLKTDLSVHGVKWLCVFGLPSPLEEDLERALRAAILLRDGRPPGLRVRGAVHAGVVANVDIGTRARRSFDVMGDAVNMAARALPFARWGEVLAWAPSAGELPGVVAEARGGRVVKGKREPMDLLALQAARPRASRTVGRHGKLVGRDREVEVLRRALEEAAGGRGSVVTVRGAPGLGKTRLGIEATRMARRLGFGVHEGRAIAYGGMGPWAVAELVRSMLGVPVAAEKAVRDGLRREVDAGRLPAADGRHLGTLLGIAPPEPHLDARGVRANGILAVRRLVRERAAATPRLLVLDDLHWADEASLQAIQELATDAPDLAVVLLLLSRDAPSRVDAGTDIELEELGPEAESELVRALLGDASPELLALVRRRGEGNPRFLEELARHLVATGACVLSGDRSVLVREPAADEIPETLESLVSSRLGTLSPAAARVLHVAAAVGRSCRTALLHGALPAEAAAGIEELVAAGILVPSPGSDPEHLFRHALVRDVAYASILTEARRTLHASVAGAIERVLASERESLLAILGHHLELGGEPVRALACYREAASRALRCHALGDAEHLLRSCIAVAPSARERAEARCDLAGEVLQIAGRIPEGIEEAARAVEELRGAGDPSATGDALVTLADLRVLQGEAKAAQDLVDAARAAYREAGDPAGELRAVGAQATIHLRQGRLGEALVAREEAVALARAIGDPTREGRAMNNLAGQLMNMGRLAEAGDLFERALQIHRASGSLRSEGIALSGLAFVRSQEGRSHEAVELCHRDLEIARTIGDRVGEGMTLGNLGILLRGLGRLAEARQASEAALRIHAEARHRSAAAIEIQSLGSLCLEMGLLEEAEDRLEQALRLHRELGDGRGQGTDLRILAVARLLRGEAGRARELQDRAVRLLSAAGDTLALLGCHVERARIELSLGEDPRRSIEEAERMLREIGLEPGSPTAKQIESLHRARRAREAGLPLLGGLCPEDLAAPLRERLGGGGPSAGATGAG